MHHNEICIASNQNEWGFSQFFGANQPIDGSSFKASSFGFQVEDFGMIRNTQEVSERLRHSFQMLKNLSQKSLSGDYPLQKKIKVNSPISRNKGFSGFKSIKQNSKELSHNSFNEERKKQKTSISQYCLTINKDEFFKEDQNCSEMWGFRRLDEDKKYDWEIEDIIEQGSWRGSDQSQILGKGAFGNVILARDKNTSEQFALKFLKKSFYSKAITETKIMKQFNEEEYIIQYHDIYLYDQQTECNQIIQVQQYLVIVMELAQASLEDILHLRMSCSAHWTLTELLFIYRHISSALKSLSRKHIVHRDLKPSNILYCTNSQSYKLADFGEAKTVKKIDFDVCHSPRGTKRYMSPELLNGIQMKKIEKIKNQLKQDSTNKESESASDDKIEAEQAYYGDITYEPFANDIYSLGVCFFQLKFLDDLSNYKGKNSKTEKTEEYFKQRLHEEEDKIDSLIYSMLQMDSKQRPNIETVLNEIEVLIKDKVLENNANNIIDYSFNTHPPISQPSQELKEEIIEIQRIESTENNFSDNDRKEEFEMSSKFDPFGCFNKGQKIIVYSAVEKQSKQQHEQEDDEEINLSFEGNKQYSKQSKQLSTKGTSQIGLSYKVDEGEFLKLMETKKSNNSTIGQKLDHYIARAQAYENLLKFQKARETFFELYQKEFSHLNPLQQVVLLKNLGRLDHKMSKFDSAIKFYHQLLGITQSHPQKLSQTEVSDVYSMIGSACCCQGDYEAALRHFGESLVIKERAGKSEEAETADLLVQIGLVKKHLGEYQSALEHYERALVITQRDPLRRNLQLGSSIKKHLGSIYDRLNNNRESISFLEAALKDMVTAYGYENERVVGCMNKLGIVLVHSGKHNHVAAITHFENAMKIMKVLYKMDTISEATRKQFRFNDPPLDNAITALYPRALYVNEEAYILYRQVYDYYHLGVAVILEIRGMIYHFLTYFGACVKYYSEALNIYTRILKPEHEFVKRCTAFLDLAKEQKDFQNFPDLSHLEGVSNSQH